MIMKGEGEIDGPASETLFPKSSDLIKYAAQIIYSRAYTRAFIYTHVPTHITRLESLLCEAHGGRDDDESRGATLKFESRFESGNLRLAARLVEHTSNKLQTH